MAMAEAPGQAETQGEERGAYQQSSASEQVHTPSLLITCYDGVNGV